MTGIGRWIRSGIPRKQLRSVAVVSLGALLAAATAHAQRPVPLDYTWTNANPDNSRWSQIYEDRLPAGIGAEDVVGNWSPNYYFDDDAQQTVIAGIPRAEDNVSIPGNAPTTLDISTQIWSLDVANPAHINWEGGAGLTIRNGPMINNGIIDINYNGGGNATLHFDNGNPNNGLAIGLGGGGTIVLNAVADANDARITTGVLDSFIHGLNHTIHGAGLLTAAFVNDGTVRSAPSTNGFTTLQVSSSQSATPDIANNNLFEATAGSNLFFTGAVQVLQNDATGRIVANGAGAKVQLNNQTIIGGRLQTQNGGVVEVVSQGTNVLQDVHNLAAINIVGNGATNAGQLVVRGAGITNDGAITVNANSFNSTSILNFDDGNNSAAKSFVLAGTGHVFLNATNGTNDALLETGVMDSVTQAAGHTIRGAGLIRAVLTNQGVIESAASTTGFTTLQFTTGTYTNQGTFRAGDGSRLEMPSAQNRLANYNAATDTLSGGRYEVIDAGAGATMDLQNAPIAVIAPGTAVVLRGENAALPQLASLTTVAGTLGIHDGKNFTTGSLAIPGRLEFALNGLVADTSLTINGNVDFTGGTLDIFDHGIAPGVYQILSWTGSRTGQLALGSTPAGFGFQLETLDTGSGVVRLTVTPEPTSALLLLLAVALAVTRFRSRG